MSLPQYQYAQAELERMEAEVNDAAKRVAALASFALVYDDRDGDVPRSTMSMLRTAVADYEGKATRVRVQRGWMSRGKP